MIPPVKNRKAVLSLALLVLLLVLVFTFFRTSVREQIRTSKGPDPSSAGTPYAAQSPTKKVTLFFVRDDDGLLAPEEREIASDPSPAREAEEVIAELIKGPTGALIASLPPETKLGQLFITKDGTAYVDFSRDLVDRHPSGTDAEVSTVYAVVNSLTLNFKTIKRVFFLIDGEERETLDGHLSLHKPFVPDYSLVAR